MTSQSKRGILGAAVALMALTAPLTAQTSMAPNQGQIVVQNNRDRPVTVYLDTRPYEIRIGEVAPFQVGQVTLPKRALRGHDRMKVFFIPKGQFGYEGEMVFENRFDHAKSFGVVVPSRRPEVQVEIGPVRIEELLSMGEPTELLYITARGRTADDWD